MMSGSYSSYKKKKCISLRSLIKQAFLAPNQCNGRPLALKTLYIHDHQCSFHKKIGAMLLTLHCHDHWRNDKTEIKNGKNANVEEDESLIPTSSKREEKFCLFR
jgi:hypothetical protein